MRDGQAVSRRAHNPKNVSAILTLRYHATLAKLVKAPVSQTGNRGFKPLRSYQCLTGVVATHLPSKQLSSVQIRCGVPYLRSSTDELPVSTRMDASSSLVEGANGQFPFGGRSVGVRGWQSVSQKLNG